MLPYYYVLIPTCILLVLTHKTALYQQRWIAYFCVFLITIFAGARGYVGTDTYAYHMMFVNFSDYSFLENVNIIEPLFVLLIKLSSLISDNSFVFSVLISIIQGLLLIGLIRTSNNPAFFLATYIAIFYLNFEFNILRAGTAILLLILAIRVSEGKNVIIFYLLGVVAVLIHYSALIVFLPMVYLRQSEIKSKLLIIVPIVAIVIILFFLVINNTLLGLGKYMVYVEEFNTVSTTTNRGFFFSLPLYILLYLSVANKTNFKDWTLLFFIWLILRCVTAFFAIVGRVEMFVNAIFLFSVIELKLVGWRRQLRSVALVCLIFLWLFGNLLVLSTVDPVSSEGVDSVNSNLMSPFNPYKFFWEEH